MTVIEKEKETTPRKSSFFDEIIYDLPLNEIFSKNDANQDYIKPPKQNIFDANEGPNNLESVVKIQRIPDGLGQINTFSCGQCDYQSKLESNVIRHAKAKHEKPLYECQQCQHRVGTRTGLKIHIESKHEGVRYSCDECDYAAITKSDLKVHKERVHEGVRYSCDKCEYKAPRKGSLKIHKVSIHEGKATRKVTGGTYNCLLYTSPSPRDS